MISFNKPYISGNEIKYIEDSLTRGHISGNGYYTKKCQSLFAHKFKLGKCLLTTSCTDALEMCAILLDIKEGDEVIMPSYNFVSAANAFIMRGATIKFVDSNKNHPNLDVTKIRPLINARTKVIVIVHYAGVACDMDELVQLTRDNNLSLVEDTAHAIGGTFKGKSLGTFGSLATFSFHETKNITSGEGGMLVINDNGLKERAEIIWEKGTNRTAFYRGEVDKYRWVDLGSSFLPSELNAAYLLAQLESFDEIQILRINAWNRYAKGIQSLIDKGHISQLPIPEEEDNLAHMFAFTVKDEATRNDLLTFLKAEGVLAVFHYLPLHLSPYYLKLSKVAILPYCESFAKRLVRLPFYTDISLDIQEFVVNKMIDFFKERTDF
ncbi:MAG: dTDP-4-amino-4,6-dideoxygalactose transaminase [Bacteroidetes bacterium]|nr:MAG: dTDP-4-amino-4,6-dideoxygalactose transaminase [Bacteroidota bacterium]